MKTKNPNCYPSTKNTHRHHFLHWIIFIILTIGIALSASSQSCGCISCSGTTIIVDQNVTVDFNTTTPTYSGDADLLPFFSYEKSGATADTWKVIFDLGSNKLLIKNGATITVNNVPNSGSNQIAPGIIIKSTCDLEMESGGMISVLSQNEQAGNISIEVNGHIIINGEIKNEAAGTNGLPGAISLSSKGGNITIGSTGLVEVLGNSNGGNTITISTCGLACYNGDITINGLVRSYASGVITDASNPDIKVVSNNGSLTVNANSVEPLYDDYSVSGVEYDLWGGLLSWIGSNDEPGKIEVQVKSNVAVNGHGDDTTGSVRKSFGGIAAISTGSNAPGGIIDIRSLEGNITGNDRAFDVSGKNKNTVTYANIRLLAKNDISLNRLGSDNSYNPVVDASSSHNGDQGGINEIRSYAGSINIGANAIISANVPNGMGSLFGNNYLTSCAGVNNNGSIVPADPVSSDDSSICSDNAPTQLFVNSCQVVEDSSPTVKGNTRVRNASELNQTQLNAIQTYPNPFNSTATVTYKLVKYEVVTIKVFNMGGKEVAKLSEGPQEAGQHTIQWNASSVPDGVYIVRMQAGDYTGVNKIIKNH